MTTPRRHREGAIRPLFDRATLSRGSTTLDPIAIRDTLRWDHVVGGRCFAVYESRVAEVDSPGDQERWAAATEGSHPVWLGAAAGIAYLQAFPLTPYGPNFTRPAEQGVRRLNLASGDWLAPLATEEGDVVSGFINSEKAVFVLSGSIPERSDAPRSYRVRRFDGRGEAPVWEKQFTSAGGRPAPGAYLWGTRGPDYASARLRGLTWLGERVLVCGGEQDDLVCLEAADGDEAWRLPRVWEFARGFIGPSVWSHYLSRFGLDRWETDKTPGLEEARRAAVEAEQVCALVAGPAVVPYVGGRDAPGYSVFVSVARGPRGGWSGYLSDCVMYELNEGGEPIGLACLPRMALPGWETGDGGVVWPCERGGFARLEPSESRSSQCGMLGGHDKLCRVSWYREMAPPAAQAWLRAGPAGDVLAFGHGRAFRTLAGGYLPRRHSEAYLFPLTAIDPGTGLDETLTLKVPFDGSVPPPETNYSSYGAPGDSERTYSLRGLQVIGSTLRIWMENQGTDAGLEYDLSRLFGDAGGR